MPTPSKPTQLLIIRHGKTFLPNQTPTRIGCRTNLPLTPQGIEEIKPLADQLRPFSPDFIFSSNLHRTIETAICLRNHLHTNIPLYINHTFNEIDYGIDENQTEDQVIKRVGSHAIDLWNQQAIPPPGWNVNPDQIRQQWVQFTHHLPKPSTTFVVTSNGIARFAPAILPPHLEKELVKTHTLKIPPASFLLFTFCNGQWNYQHGFPRHL